MGTGHNRARRVSCMLRSKQVLLFITYFVFVDCSHRDEMIHYQMKETLHNRNMLCTHHDEMTARFTYIEGVLDRLGTTVLQLAHNSEVRTTTSALRTTSTRPICGRPARYQYAMRSVLPVNTMLTTSTSWTWQSFLRLSLPPLICIASTHE